MLNHSFFEGEEWCLPQCGVPFLLIKALDMCRPSYIEGRLRLAENRERQRGKGAAPAAGALTDGPPTAEERAAAEKAAEANMARLLQEEDAAKVRLSCSISHCALCNQANGDKPRPVSSAAAVCMFLWMLSAFLVQHHGTM